MAWRFLLGSRAIVLQTASEKNFSIIVCYEVLRAFRIVNQSVKSLVSSFSEWQMQSFLFVTFGRDCAAWTKKVLNLEHLNKFLVVRQIIKALTSIKALDWTQSEARFRLLNTVLS